MITGKQAGGNQSERRKGTVRTKNTQGQKKALAVATKQGVPIRDLSWAYLHCEEGREKAEPARLQEKE